MADNKMVGLEIGNHRIKLAYSVKGKLQSYTSALLPDDIVKNGMVVYWDALADFLRETMKANDIRCKKISIALPSSAVYVRIAKLPIMTIEQLKINLPFEFHDYITDDPKSYVFDYAVIEKNEKTMTIIAVACAKDIVTKYKAMCKGARLELTTLIPDVIGYERIIQQYNKTHEIDGTKDYAIVDLGDQAIKIHFFKGGYYELTRTLEPGCHALASAFSDMAGQDIHISKIELEENSTSIEDNASLSEICTSMAMQIMRVLNFYSFNNSNNTIDALYYCGGGSFYEPLIKEIGSQLTLPTKSIAELFPEMDADLADKIILSPQCYGVTIG